MSITSPFLTASAPFACEAPAAAPPVGEGLAPPSSAPPSALSVPAKAPPPSPNPHAAPTPTVKNPRRVVRINPLFSAPSVSLRLVLFVFLFSAKPCLAPKPKKLSFRPKQADAFSLAFASRERVGLRSGETSLTLFLPHPSLFKSIRDSHSSLLLHCSSQVTSLPV